MTTRKAPGVFPGHQKGELFFPRPFGAPGARSPTRDGARRAREKPKIFGVAPGGSTPFLPRVEVILFIFDQPRRHGGPRSPPGSWGWGNRRPEREERRFAPGGFLGGWGFPKKSPKPPIHEWAGFWENFKRSFGGFFFISPFAPHLASLKRWEKEFGPPFFQRPRVHMNWVPTPICRPQKGPYALNKFLGEASILPNP